MTLSQADKWFKQAKVIDGKTISTTDTAITFNRFKWVYHYNRQLHTYTLGLHYIILAILIHHALKEQYLKSNIGPASTILSLASGLAYWQGLLPEPFPEEG